MCASSANCVQLAARFLDGLNVLCRRGQPRHRVRLQVCRRPSRHVVHAHRERVHALAPAPESAGTAPPASACCNTDWPTELPPRPGIAPQQRGLPQQRARRVVRAPGPHRDAPRRRLDHEAHGVQPLVLVQRGRLARRPAGHQKVDSRLDLPVHQRPQRRLVHRSIRLERRNNCGTTTCRFHNSSSL